MSADGRTKPLYPTYGPEEWRPVASFDGAFTHLYEVSSEGRVRSLARSAPSGFMGVRTLPGRAMRTSPGGDGYPVVGLRRDGLPARRGKVHRLVAEAFIPNPSDLPNVLHWDDDPLNNNVSNLRWGTLSQNNFDAVRNSRHVNANKTHCLRGHLLEEPNLVPHRLRAGVRQCRACQAERIYCWKRGIEFSEARADDHFQRLMGGTR